MTLEELYRNHRRQLIFKIFPYTHSFDTAEDLVQEAFVKAHLYAHQYNPDKGNIKTWFTKILFSILWNHLRAAKKGPITFDIEDVLESEFLSYEATPNLQPYVETIKNPRHKSVLLGYFILGYTPTEISKLLGLKRNNVRKIVQRFKESQDA